MTKAYSYDPITGLYAGEVDLVPSPADGMMSLPGFATLEPPPPLRPDERAVWRNGRWYLVVVRRPWRMRLAIQLLDAAYWLASKISREIRYKKGGLSGDGR